MKLFVFCLFLTAATAISTALEDERPADNFFRDAPLLKDRPPRRLAIKKDRVSPLEPLEKRTREFRELVREAERIAQEIKEVGCAHEGVSKYNITVYTHDRALAGTSARVYVDLYGKLYGQLQSTGKRQLVSKESPGQAFNRGRVDTFLVKTLFVGIVERITIEHDNSGLFPDWNLHKIVIRDLKLGTHRTFICDCVLSGFDNTKTLPPVDKA